METIDLRSMYKELYRPSAKSPVIVEVPRMRFLMVHGSAYPGKPEYIARMQALFTVAYPLKFTAKKELGIDYPVMPPEGLYWDPTGAPLTDVSQDATMLWTLMSLVPDDVTPEFMAHVRDEVKRKKGEDVPPVDELVIEDYIEGTCVQVMHIGPYDAELPTIGRMREFAAEKGYGMAGKHHEIYLGDPNKAAPEKLKTILRSPVRRMA